jgi:hypothetical protein
MADILLQGTTYNNVPYVDLPTTSSGTARFHEDALKMGVLRNDAELVNTWSKDSMFISDDGGTIPAYSTSAKTLIAGANITPTASLTFASYNYYVIERMLTIPSYNTTKIEKSRNEYSVTSAVYEVVEIPASTFKTLDGSKTFTSRSTNVLASSAMYRMLYWSSATAISLYTANYGVYQSPNTPSISSSTLTIKNPSLQMRGSTSYLTQSVWGTISDIRYQYVIELYRVPKNNLNLDGWGIYTQAMHIVDCVKTASHTLS